MWISVTLSNSLTRCSLQEHWWNHREPWSLCWQDPSQWHQAVGEWQERACAWCSQHAGQKPKKWAFKIRDLFIMHNTIFPPHSSHIFFVSSSKLKKMRLGTISYCACVTQLEKVLKFFDTIMSHVNCSWCSRKKKLCLLPWNMILCLLLLFVASPGKS